MSALVLNQLGNAEGALGRWAEAMGHYREAAEDPEMESIAGGLAPRGAGGAWGAQPCADGRSCRGWGADAAAEGAGRGDETVLPRWPGGTASTQASGRAAPPSRRPAGANYALAAFETGQQELAIKEARQLLRR